MTSFKIDDRVRILRHYHETMVGRCGDVVAVTEQEGVVPRLTIELNDGRTTFADADAVESTRHTTDVTLRITWDDDEVEPPETWEWHEVIDCGRDDVKVVEPALDRVLVRAEWLARALHAEDVRGDEVPYVDHLAAVAGAVAAEGRAPEVIAAAWLHDVAEGVNLHLTVGEVRRLFGERVGELVDALTRRPPERYFDYIDRVAAAGEDAVAVKLADLRHNLSDLPEGDTLGARYLKALARLTRTEG